MRRRIFFPDHDDQCFDCLNPVGYGLRLRTPREAVRMGQPATVCIRCHIASKAADDDAVPDDSPDPATIADRAAMIRAEWTSGEERRRRRSDWLFDTWEAPQVAMATSRQGVLE